MRPHSALLALTLLSTLAGGPARARERSEIPEAYTWNLSDLYPSDEAWQKARDEARARLPQMAAHKGHLGDSAGALKKGLEAMFGQRLALERLYVYASSRSDEDTRADGPRAMRQEIQQLLTEAETAFSFVRPEILAAVFGALGNVLDPLEERGERQKRLRPAHRRQRAYTPQGLVRARPARGGGLGAGLRRSCPDPAGHLRLFITIHASSPTMTTSRIGIQTPP